MPSMVFGVFLRAIYTFKTLNCTVAYGLWGDFWHLGGGGHGPLKSAYDLTVQSRSMNKGHLQHAILAEPKRMSDAKTPLSADKVKDLKSMLNYMPEPDREYMKTLLKCPKQDCKVQQVDDQTVRKSLHQEEAGPSGKVAKKAKENPVAEPRKSIRQRSSRHQEVGPNKKIAMQAKESPVAEPRNSVRKRSERNQEVGPNEKIPKKAKESPVVEPSNSVRKRSARHQEVGPSEKIAMKAKESPVVEPSNSVQKRSARDQQDTEKLVQVGKQRKRARRA